MTKDVKVTSHRIQGEWYNNQITVTLIFCGDRHAGDYYSMQIHCSLYNLIQKNTQMSFVHHTYAWEQC